MVSKEFGFTFCAFAALLFVEGIKSLATVGRHLPMRFSVVFIPFAPAPLVAPRNIAPAAATSLRPPSLSC
jgi:hypothetical protein